jgi:hypothetical protein
MREIDILFVANGGPLEGRPMQALAGRTVAVFGVNRGFAAELVLDAAAVALGGVAGDEAVGGSVDAVRGVIFPGLIGLVEGGVMRAVVALFTSSQGHCGDGWVPRS